MCYYMCYRLIHFSRELTRKRAITCQQLMGACIVKVLRELISNTHK